MASFDPSEKEIENSILQYLNFQIGCFAFKVNTMGVFDQRLGKYRRTSKFIIPGTPDILASYNIKGVGVFLCFEVKSASGRQSKEQKAFEDKLTTRTNGFYFLVRSVKEVEDALVRTRAIVGVNSFGGAV